MNSLDVAIIRGTVLLVTMCASLFSTSYAQEMSAIDPALRHAVQNHRKTVGEAQKYTYTEHSTNINFDSKGATKLHVTDTYDIIFLEGAPYQKHVLHNEQPLSSKEQKAEENKLADVAKARLEHRSSGLFHTNFRFEFPLDQLATQFDVKQSGSEDLDGRHDLVFTAHPKSLTAEALKQAARDGVAYEMKLWVDQQDQVLSQIEGEVIADGMRYEKGTLVTFKFQKVNDEAWLPARFWFKGKVRYMMTDVPTEAEQTYSNYKKFKVDVNLTSN